MTKQLEWGELWTAMDAAADAWIPTTENMYDEMLNVLPPAAMGAGGFLVGEPHHHNDAGEPVYAGFVRAGRGYFARYLTVREFRVRPQVAA